VDAPVLFEMDFLSKSASTVFMWTDKGLFFCCSGMDAQVSRQIE